MTDIVETVRLYLQLIFAILALLWFPVEIAYRLYHSRRLKVGYWDVDPPLWHRIAFWPIVLGLFLLFTWGMFL